MRTVTFADPKVVDLLNEKFVVVWHNLNPDNAARGTQATYTAAEMAAYPEGGGGTNLYTVVAAPDGTVLNNLLGYWSAPTLLEELDFSLGLTAENKAERHAARRNALQAQVAKLDLEHPGEAGKRVKESPVLRRKAALNLLATWHTSGRVAEGKVDGLLEMFGARTRTRVIS